VSQAVSAVQGTSIEALGQQATAAMAAGRLEEAAALWQRVLESSPDHPAALLHLGQHALYRKEPRKALALLERAATISRDNSVIPLNIAFAHRALGDSAAEMAAIRAALAIDPYYYPALLSKAMLLERLGDKRQAAKVYKDVLVIAPSLEDAPQGLKGPLTHARDVVRENAAALEEFLESRLRDVRARHKDEDLSRFEQCKDATTGAKKVYVQQPLLLHVPAVPAIQYYDEKQFPWLKELEAATDDIREEFLKIYEEDRDIRPYINRPDDVPVNQWLELNRSPKWSVYFLYEDGKRIDEHCARCPKTAAVLEKLPLVDIPNLGPTVNFSLLAPHTRIPPHTGSTNARLITHLPLIVPGKCYFRVGNETREWQVGKAWVFDDTIEHEAWNDSDQLRVILMLDIWNPYLTAAEHDLIRVLLNGMLDYYRQNAARPQAGG